MPLLLIRNPAQTVDDSRRVGVPRGVYRRDRERLRTCRLLRDDRPRDWAGWTIRRSRTSHRLVRRTQILSRGPTHQRPMGEVGTGHPEAAYALGARGTVSSA